MTDEKTYLVNNAEELARLISIKSFTLFNAIAASQKAPTRYISFEVAEYSFTVPEGVAQVFFGEFFGAAERWGPRAGHENYVIRLDDFGDEFYRPGLMFLERLMARGAGLVGHKFSAQEFAGLLCLLDYFRADVKLVAAVFSFVPKQMAEELVFDLLTLLISEPAAVRPGVELLLALHPSEGANLSLFSERAVWSLKTVLGYSAMLPPVRKSRTFQANYRFRQA